MDNRLVRTDLRRHGWSRLIWCTQYGQKIKNACPRYPVLSKNQKRLCRHSVCSTGLGAGRLGREDRALRLSTLGLTVAVKPLALTWKLVQMSILTIWGHQPTLKYAMAARCDSNCRGKLSSDDRTGARWAAGLFGDPMESIATSSASSVMRLGGRPGERVRASSRFHASSAMRWVGCSTTDPL